MLHVRKRGRGEAIAQWLIMLLLVGLSIFYFAVDLPRIALVGDMVLQRALDRTAQTAAGQYDASSLAVGLPRIDQAAATLAAREHLAAELNLDPATLAPRAGSPLVDTPTFELVVYNGPTFPYVLTAPDGHAVTLSYPGVMVLLDAKIELIAPLSTGDGTATIHSYAWSTWMPRTKP
jgi:hypothetical protein